MTTQYKSKKPGATFDGYSRNNKFSETFFYYPTRNKHINSEYEARHSYKAMNTFRTKGRSYYQEYMYGSSLNPLAKNVVRVQKVKNEMGQKKRTFEDQSFKPTDPLCLRYQRAPAQSRFRAPFESSVLYKTEMQNKHYLPSDRQLSPNKRNYHHQLGLSFSPRQKIVQRQAINNSNLMRSTIQYRDHSLSRCYGSLDDFKYGSLK